MPCSWLASDMIRPANRNTCFITHHAVTLVELLFGGATVARHRHPAGVREEPALFALVADHGGQHGKRNVVHLAHVDASHHEVKKHEDAGTYLGDTGKRSAVSCGRRGTNTDDGAG